MCECVTDMYFSYKKWALKSIEVKFINVEQLCSMHLCTKFRSSALSHSEEIRIESWQNVALPADQRNSQFEKNVGRICFKIRFGLFQIYTSNQKWEINTLQKSLFFLSMDCTHWQMSEFSRCNSRYNFELYIVKMNEITNVETR